jgi:hypothetical protein
MNNNKQPEKQKDPLPWNEHAVRQFQVIIRLIMVFAALTLVLIGWTAYGKYRIEDRKLELEEKRNKDRTAGTPGASSATNELHAPVQADGLTREQSLAIIEKFVIAESTARVRQGKSPGVPFSAITSLIDTLQGTVGLTKEAGAAVNEMRRDLFKAGIDVGVDTVKKITAKLLEGKPEEKPAVKARETAGLQNNLNVSLSCMNERPQVSGPPKKPQPKTPVPLPGPKMMCPVPLVPVARG